MVTSLVSTRTGERKRDQKRIVEYCCNFGKKGGGGLTCLHAAGRGKKTHRSRPVAPPPGEKKRGPIFALKTAG